ncbi:MAG: peptidylprolyl isomerase [Boseongicola sp.]|nr:MAG: peptidylprolyl isomerase [Boseongicola sp.]
MLIKRTIYAAAVAFVALSAPASSDNHADPNMVVASVNGTDITLAHMIVLKQRLPEQYQQLPPNVLFDGILDQLVQQTLLGQDGDDLTIGSRATLDNEERLLRASQVMQELSEQASTDAALQATYDASYGAIEPETEFNASHILVDTEEEAIALVDQLNGGADFALLAQEKSTGPSGPNGGQLGWFGIGAMVPPFEAAVIALDPGNISAPVQTQFGWHVVRLNEKRQKDAPTLEQVRGEIEQQVQRQAIEARAMELTETATISRMTVDQIDPALLDDISILGE